MDFPRVYEGDNEDLASYTNTGFGDREVADRKSYE